MIERNRIVLDADGWATVWGAAVVGDRVIIESVRVEWDGDDEEDDCGTWRPDRDLRDSEVFGAAGRYIVEPEEAFPSREEAVDAVRVRALALVASLRGRADAIERSLAERGGAPVQP